MCRWASYRRPLTSRPHQQQTSLEVNIDRIGEFTEGQLHALTSARTHARSYLQYPSTVRMQCAYHPAHVSAILVHVDQADRAVMCTSL